MHKILFTHFVIIKNKNKITHLFAYNHYLSLPTSELFVHFENLMF